MHPFIVYMTERGVSVYNVYDIGVSVYNINDRLTAQYVFINIMCCTVIPN